MGLRDGSLVCDHCSSTVFVFESFQIAWTAKDSPDPKAGFSYTTQTWQEIDEGENMGCNWCDILWGEIPFWYQHRKKKEYPLPEETFKITIRFEKRKAEDEIIIKVIVEDDWGATYQVQCDPDDDAAAFIPSRKLIWQVSSPRAFKLASDCLAQCTLRHHCSTHREANLPTRVVDCSKPERPKLVLTKGMPQGSYAALSYVWGEPQPHSVCTANLTTYLESIDVLLLPKTIRDAILCTYKLNLQYLWVDTLCILQDLDEDKIREIPQMCDIYRGAYVTIIAASAEKVSEGFLHNRKKPVEMLLPFWCPDQRLGTISVDDETSARPSQEPVNHRAWCFQERLLSHRMLVYASHTLQYQCQAAITDIGDIWRYLPSKELGELRLPDMMMMSQTPCAPLSHNDKETLSAAWWAVLSDYTQRAVTNPSDTLVAISGIAQLFQRCWGSNNRYIAGIWERDLSTDLLWYRSSPSDGHLIKGQYLAPSWSWAATIGRVVGGSVGKIIWDVRSCEAIPLSENHPLGQVKGGKLTVKAILRNVTWDPAEPQLFELKQPYSRVDHPRDSELPAIAGEGDIRAGPAFEEDKVNNGNLGHVDSRKHKTEQGKKALKSTRIERVFQAVANWASKLMPCHMHRTNLHLAQDIAEIPPIAAEGNTTRASNAQDHTIDAPVTVGLIEESIAIIINSATPSESGRGGHPESPPDPRQSSKVTVRERHIGYVYFDCGGIEVDRGIAVVVGSDKGENPSHLTGLVVVPARNTGEFTRVGMFHAHDGRSEDDEDAPHCDVQSWLNEPSKTITII